MYGQCNTTYLVLGNYCRYTCGRCTQVEGGPEAAPAAEPAAADGAPPADGAQPAVVAAGGSGGRKLI